MIRDLIFEKVRDAAELAGLPPDKVMPKSVKDNQTQKRPRLELQFLDETYTRSGRGLGLIHKEPGQAFRKKELYQVSMPVAGLVLADNGVWLQEFCYRFIAFLTRGFNDFNGNYVQMTASQGAWSGFEEKRIATTVIEPIVKRETLIHINAVWRITAEEAAEMITSFDLKIGGFKNGHE